MDFDAPNIGIGKLESCQATDGAKGIKVLELVMIADARANTRIFAGHQLLISSSKTFNKFPTSELRR